jgi:tetratricopeptide (TPR) repeat protein
VAIARGKHVLEIDPGFGVALFVLGLSYEQLGQFEEAIAYFRKAFEISKNYIALEALIHAVGVSGIKEEAKALLEQLLNASAQVHVSPYTKACAYLGLDDLATAMDLLEKAVDTHSVWLIHLHMKSDPRLDPLRKEKRFLDLLTRMGL